MAAAMMMISNSLPVCFPNHSFLQSKGLNLNAVGQNDTVGTMVGCAFTYLLVCGAMGQFVSPLY
ncbi:hypothetical protein BC826DRAFT_982471, partial [Russula brevipes]